MSSRSRQDLPPGPSDEPQPLRVLRAEFKARGVGPAFIAEVRRSARRIAPRYVATKYSSIGNWTHGLDDLVQDVIHDSLLRDGQAEYMLQVSASLADLRRLLDRQTRRVLARHRRRTVIDALLARARRILEAEPFAAEARSGIDAFRLACRSVEVRAASLPELADAADVIRDIPTVPQRGGRASMVYSTADLVELLHRVAWTLPCVFTVRELDRILEHVLTPFLPSVLDLDAGPGDDVAPNLIGEDEALAVFSVLTQDEAIVLALKAAGIADVQVAASIGVSRPTAANIKHRAFGKVRLVLSDVDDGLRLAAIDRLGVRTRGVVSVSLPSCLPLSMRAL